MYLYWDSVLWGLFHAFHLEVATRYLLQGQRCRQSSRSLRSASCPKHQADQFSDLAVAHTKVQGKTTWKKTKKSWKKMFKKTLENTMKNGKADWRHSLKFERLRAADLSGRMLCVSASCRRPSQADTCFEVVGFFRLKHSKLPAFVLVS